VAYTALALPDASRYPHSGLSNFLDVQVDTTTDAVAVRAQVPNPDGLLTAGGVVRVTVERGAPRSALTIPQSAVLLDQAGRYVLLVNAKKKVEQRRVTIGIEQDAVASTAIVLETTTIPISESVPC
jgi:membrane fusion protein, multidrug efflux system